MDRNASLEEKAKRAYRKFGELTPTLSGMASALAGKDMVVKAGQGTMTEGKVISIRPPIALADMPEHERRLCDERNELHRLICPACASRESIIGSLFHELGHICFGSFEESSLANRIKGMEDWLEEPSAKRKFTANMRNVLAINRDNPLYVAGALNKFLPGLTNALEDVRVDAAMVEARPGVADMHRANFMELAEFGYDNGKKFSDFDLNIQLSVAVIAKAKGHPYAEYFDEYVIATIDSPEIHELVMNVPNLRKVGDVMAYAFRILVLAQAAGFFIYDEQHMYVKAYEPEPEGGSEGDESESTDDTAGDGGAGDPASEDGDASERSESADASDSAGRDSEEGDDPAGGESGRDDDGTAEPDSGEPESDSELDRPERGDGDEREDGAGGGADEGDSDSSDEEHGDDDGASGGEDVSPEDAGDTGNPEAGDNPSGDVPVDEPEDSDTEGDRRGDAGAKSVDRDVARDSSEGDEDSSDDGATGEPGESGADGSGPGSGSADDAGAAGDATGAPDDVADDGPLEDSASTTPARPAEDEFGDDASEAAETLAILTGHSDHDIDMSPVEESVMDRVVGSLENFDEVSVAISKASLIDVEKLTAHTFQSVLKPVPESILGPATLHMRRVFADNAFAKRDRNRRSGRLEKRVLGRRAWSDDDRLFGKKQKPGKRDYAVLIGIDASGSTAGGARHGCTTIELELQAAKAQAELCHRTGIKFAVFAHSGTRSELAIVPIKKFDEPWNRKAEIKLAKVNAFAANLDGHTVEWYRKELEKVRATDKILMYYSDGAMPAENYIEELTILKREIKTFQSRGITLMAVGARTDDPRAHGLDTVRIDNMTDIPKVVKHLGKRLEQG